MRYVMLAIFREKENIQRIKEDKHRVVTALNI